MDRSGAGAGFLRELRFPLPIYISAASPQSFSLSPEAGTIGQEWPQCQWPHKPNNNNNKKIPCCLSCYPPLISVNRLMRSPGSLYVYVAPKYAIDSLRTSCFLLTFKLTYEYCLHRVLCHLKKF
jgi:hypothetical protein